MMGKGVRKMRSKRVVRKRWAGVASSGPSLTFQKAWAGTAKTERGSLQLVGVSMRPVTLAMSSDPPGPQVRAPEPVLAALSDRHRKGRPSYVSAGLQWAHQATWNILVMKPGLAAGPVQGLVQCGFVGVSRI